jgi:hypothetical protein
VKKDKQLDESKLCSFFAKPQKQIGGGYFYSITKLLRKDFFAFLPLNRLFLRDLSLLRP